MAKGNWLLTGDTIKIDTNYRLLDGQHRLLAVIKSGAIIETCVAHHVESGGRFIDRGRPRKLSNYLAHEGVKHASIVAAAARLHVLHDKGLWAKPSVQTGDILDSEVYECVERRKVQLERSAALACKSKKVLT